eukprot:4538833-Pyramimonas_sp.AAC.1
MSEWSSRNRGFVSDSVEGDDRREELQPIRAERASEIRESAATCSRKFFDMISSRRLVDLSIHLLNRMK